MAAKGWTMTAVAIAVAAGTYFTLETIYPPSRNGDVDLRLVSADTVFGGELQPAAADSVPASDAADTGVAELVPVATPDVTDLAADATADGDAGQGDVPDAAVDEAVDAQATIDETSAAPTPAGAATGDIVAQADAATDVAEATPRATPAPTPAPTAAATARPAPKATPAARLTPWWGSESAERLSVVYAGSAAYTRAIVLMFNGPFQDAVSAQQHLQVRDTAGKPVAGRWEVGASNRRMLLFPVARTGTYSVTVGAGLTDQNGRRVGSQLQGPVRVQ